MLWFRSVIFSYMKRELEGDSLVRSGAVKQRHGRTDRFEIEIVKRVLQGAKEIRYPFSINVGSTAYFTGLLNTLLIV